MSVHFPPPNWPSDLNEQGPAEDPSILLGGDAVIGTAHHRVIAVRMNPRTLSVDYRADVAEEIYDDYQLEDMLDAVTFLDDIDNSVLVALGGKHYVIGMMPSSAASHE